MYKRLTYFSILNLVIQLYAQQYIQSNVSESGIFEYARFYTNQYCSQSDETAIKSATFQSQFQSTPQILVGILFLDVSTLNYRTAFNFTVKSVDQKQVQIQFNKYGPTCVYGIKIQYFAIVDQDIKIQTFSLLFNEITDIQIQNNKSYYFALQQKSGKLRSVQCLIIGYDSTYQIVPSNDTSLSKRNLLIKTSIDSSNNFYQIQVQAPDLQANLKVIYVNCMEYYQGQAGDYSMIQNVSKNELTLSIKDSQNFSIQLDSSFKGTTVSSFLGLTQLELSQKDALRIEYENFSFSSNSFSYKLITWSNSILYSSTAIFFQHQMIDCKSSQNLINSAETKQCVQTCQNGQYPAAFQSTQVCTPCSSNCVTCSNYNICTTCQQNQFLDLSSHSCKSCDSSCVTCKDSATQCLSCPKSQYLYNQKCYYSQPLGTYCDQNLTCTDCIASFSCSFCNSSLQVCASCISQNFYFLDGVCSVSQPTNAYCDQQKICQKCPATCNGCNLNQKCLNCANQQNFFYYGDCLEQQPPSTYCVQDQNINKYCQNCHPACSSCFGQQLNQCLGCQSGYQLVNSYCLCQAGYGYSNTSQQCEACQISGCKQCSKNLNECEVCQDNLLLDQATKKCYCSNQQEYYSTQQQTCIQNQVKYCKTSSKYQNQCDQCEDGYYNYNNQFCSYCGRGKYTDSQNQCVKNCLSQCIICSNDSTCLLYVKDIDSSGNLSDDQNNYSNVCDYSCGLCNGKEKTNCLTCSSKTRVYDFQQQTCECMAGYLDQGKADCAKPYDISQSVFGIDILDCLIMFCFIK